MNPWGSRIVAMAALAVCAPTASAAMSPRPPLLPFAMTRYALPSGSSSFLNPCTDSANPCALRRAINVANSGDEVVVEPGDYQEKIQLGVTKQLYIHGVQGQPRPRLISSVTGGLDAVKVTSAHTTIRYLEIQSSISGGLALQGAFDTVRELVVRSTSQTVTSEWGCRVNADEVTLIDTICTAPAFAVWAVVPGSGQGAHLNLRNVTAVGGTGLYVSSSSSGRAIDATVVNTIARGQAYDVVAASDAQSTAKVFLSYSNYDRAHSSEGVYALIWNSGHNQSAPPGFVKAPPPFTDPGTDFHQALGSPTINAGQTDDASNGPFDFEGDPRTLGTATDIGADEFAPFAPRPATAGGPPAIRSAFLGAPVFAVDTTGPPAKSGTVRRIAFGTVINYTLSKAARVKFTVQDSRSRLIGRFTQAGRPGPNSKPWSGRIGRRTLSAGRYRVTLVATDSAGKRSRPKTIGFKVIRP